MLRLVLSLFLAAFSAFSAFAACPPSTFPVYDLNLTADGKILRMQTVSKVSDSQNGTVHTEEVVRDSISIVPGDELLLNAAPTAQDVLIQAKIILMKQVRDSKGTFSTTYRIDQMVTGNYGTKTTSKSVKSFYTTIKSNYVGNGVYDKNACGDISHVMISSTQNL